MTIISSPVTGHLTDKLGSFSWFGYELPFAERLTCIRNAGFRRISIWLGPEERMVTEGRVHDMCRIAADAQLFVECAHAPYGGVNLIWSGSDTNRKGFLDEMKKHIIFCGGMRVPTMVLHVSKGESPPMPNREGLALLREMAEVAGEAGVALAIENTRKPDTVDFVFSEIDSPHMGLCYDSSHDFLFSNEPGMILKRWGHRLLYTHLSDNDGKSDRHWLPGEGSIDWGLVAGYFPRGFAGSISLEVQPKDQDREPLDWFLGQSLAKALWLKDLLLT